MEVDQLHEGQSQMSIEVEVKALDGTKTTLHAQSSNTVGDVAKLLERKVGSSNSNLSSLIRFFAPVRGLLQETTTLEDLSDGSSVVRLIQVAFQQSSRKKRRKARKEEVDPTDLPPLPNGYSLQPGLDTCREALIDTEYKELKDGQGEMARRRVCSSSNSGLSGTASAPSCPTRLIPLLKSKYKERLHFERVIKGRKGAYVPVDDAGIPGRMVSCLRSGGLDMLYQHQLEAYEHREGNFMVTTATSSGKSLCYLLSMMSILLEDDRARALVVFPTKALANDQLNSIRQMAVSLFGPSCVDVLDGDTSMEEREEVVQRKPRLVISNPDFVSMSMLPYHESRFKWFFDGLRVIVLDEAHVYSGVFGTHVAMVVRRLKRITHLHAGEADRRLRMYLSSATIANASSFATTLIDDDVVMIEKDSSPSTDKTFVVWLPPLVSKSTLRRKSPVYEAAILMAECICASLRTIVFAKTRKLAELVFGYTQEILVAKEETRHLSRLLAVYRAGFTPLERRDIESKLFRGLLLGVSATNALELGIDVGGLDVSIHLGWQGSRASLFQQAGRCGRRGRKSLAFFVPFDGVLDRHFVQQPEKLFNGIEPTLLDMSNPKIVASHLRCAAFEYPLCIRADSLDLSMFGSTTKAVVESLVEAGELSPLGSTHEGTLAYSGKDIVPARTLTLRSIDPEVVTILDRRSGNIMEQIEAFKAPFVVYPGAVYSKLGVRYLIDSVDWESKTAHAVRAPALAYYTTVVDCTEVKTVLNTIDGRPQAQSADVAIRFAAFCRRRRKTGVVIDTCRLHGVPEVKYSTMALVVRLPKRASCLDHTPWSAEAVHGAAHALIAVLPRFLMVGEADVSAECNVEHCRYISERLLLFDRASGGSGIAERMVPIFGKMVDAAVGMLGSCGCKGDPGCPSCTHLSTCSTYNKNINKIEAMELLRQLLNCSGNF